MKSRFRLFASAALLAAATLILSMTAPGVAAPDAPVSSANRSVTREMKLDLKITAVIEGLTRNVDAVFSEKIVAEETALPGAGKKKIYYKTAETHESMGPEKKVRRKDVMGKKYLLLEKTNGVQEVKREDGKDAPVNETQFVRDELDYSKNLDQAARELRGVRLVPGMDLTKFMNKRMGKFTPSKKKSASFTFHAVFKETRESGGVKQAVITMKMKGRESMDKSTFLKVEMEGEFLIDMKNYRPSSFLMKGPAKMIPNKNHPGGFNGVGEFSFKLLFDYGPLSPAK